MAWYEKTEPKQLDYSKPIVCEEHGRAYILLPQMNYDPDPESEADYTIVGYNWFDFKSGEYNSCAFYKTVGEALRHYGRDSCRNYEGHV